MTGRAVANYRRKSVLNLQLHTEDTFEVLVRHKLECGKFLTTKTGWIKLIGVFLLVAALAMFFGTSWCDDTPSWYPILFPVSIGISITIQTILYVVFSFGVAASRPRFWIKIDIFLNFVFSILSAISSIVSLNECHEDQFQQTAGSLGIAGAVASLVGCGALFLFYKYKNDDEPTPPESPVTRMDPRKSLHV